jgi:acetylglutamate kinase
VRTDLLERLSADRGAYYVVKIGGELIPRRLAGVAQAVNAFVAAGIRTVIVHGGGPQATALTRRLGLEPVQIAGRRVTDDAVLQVMKMALGGEASVDLAAALRAGGVRALAVHGVSAGLVDAVKRPPRVITGGPPEPVDLGQVGDVVGVNVELLALLTGAGWVPAIASIGGDAQGRVYNINADAVANAVAARLSARRMLAVSGVPGVLRDPADPASRIARLTASEARALIASGAIGGGMVPKVEESLAALAAGVGAVHVVGDAEGALLAEVLEPGSSGTMIEV